MMDSEQSTATKHAASVSAVRAAADPQGKGWLIGVVAKRTWQVTRGKCELAALQVPIVEELIYDEKKAILVHDADVLLLLAYCVW